FDPLKVPFAKLKGARGAGPLTGKIRMGLMTHGVDIMGAPGGFVSAMHGGTEIEKTAHALRQTVRALKAEREVKAAQFPPRHTLRDGDIERSSPPASYAGRDIPRREGRAAVRVGVPR